jgi:hypothetical protein
MSLHSSRPKIFNVGISFFTPAGAYTVFTQSIGRHSPRHLIWEIHGHLSTSLDQFMMDRKDLMLSALHGLLSATDMFHGDCKEYTHLISNSQGNRYLALYQITRLAHPLLGQVTAQNEQPQHCKSQPFSEHISHYIDYFQSEARSGCQYPLKKQVILIISRLHLTWRDATKKKYNPLVSQNGITPPCTPRMLTIND